MNGWILLTTALGLIVGFWLGTRRRQAVTMPGDAATAALPRPGENVAGQLYAIAEALTDPMEQTAHPGDALNLPDFQRGVALLCDDTVTREEVLAYVIGTNWILCCMAGEALCRRQDEDASETLLAHIPNLGPWPMFYVLRYLRLRHRGPLIGAVAAQAQEWWSQAPPLQQLVSELMAERTAQGEAATFGGALEACSAEDLHHIAAFLHTLREGAAASLLAEVETWQHSRVDSRALETIGRLWERPHLEDSVRHSGITPHLDRLEECLARSPVRSVALVGEPGVGKTTLVNLLADRLRGQGWTVFEAGAQDIMAGQMRVGELEGRIKELLENLRTDRRVLWYIPNFHELLYAGMHQYSPLGLLDLLLPALESGAIAVVGETTPQGYELVEQQRKRIRTAVEAIRVQPLSDAATLALAREWAARKAGAAPLLDPALFDEAFSLARQHFTEYRAPGNLLQLLKLTHERVNANGQSPGPMTLDDLLATLAGLTGLPRDVLDDRQALDLSELRRGFEQRIVGQTETVDCLVDRIAMLKAGLTDPSRPLGVFLFVGPTGTGKTEIAKTLAQYLFGASERMVRLDMSEFQDAESLSRILGETDPARSSNALVNLIRKQPFSVVLLDEFEKAHPNVWDLFLQVFDDGRLTDRAGNLADFRHSIIILTSNLGATLSAGTSIGFTQGSRSFSPSSVEKAVASTFRPEFINRLDRVLVFHPLSRGTMRKILRKELDDALLRRGLRKRQWAVEWDESAFDFLLERGFTPELGARPLKRAIERYLLSPLSVAIVEHRFPEGDQFLFVSGGESRLEVTFVDPDAPPGEYPAPAEVEPTPAELHGLDLRTIALEPDGSPAQLRFLVARLEGLSALVEAHDWQREKADALAKTGSPGFWEAPSHVAVLSRIELMDRIEAGLQSAGSLLNRLNRAQAPSPAGHAPELLRRLAEQLYLLDIAHTDLTENRPLDAFLSIEARVETKGERQHAVEFFHQLVGMYQQWGKNRRMQLECLSGQLADSDHLRYLTTVSGFGAYSILRPEAGLHVLETPKGEQKAFSRSRVRVRITPQPDTYARNHRELVRFAEQAFARLDDGAPAVVRRYRLKPSPLVRDSVRNWRTGRLDRVLGGDFDLIT